MHTTFIRQYKPINSPNKISFIYKPPITQYLFLVILDIVLPENVPMRPQHVVKYLPLIISKNSLL